jgi:hypothetical protein
MMMMMMVRQKRKGGSRLEDKSTSCFRGKSFGEKKKIEEGKKKQKRGSEQMQG